jgi:hypothetical protein
MAQRDNRRIDMHQSAAGPTGRCPVQSSTPLGPDQVNVIIIIITLKERDVTQQTLGYPRFLKRGNIDTDIFLIAHS